jgi:hypothetical protein
MPDFSRNDEITDDLFFQPGHGKDAREPGDVHVDRFNRECRTIDVAQGDCTGERDHRRGVDRRQ